MQDLDVAQGTLPAGFQFGAYVIGACIGQGGMARIYRSEHRVLRKPVALKVMEPTLLERPDGRPRFLREGQAAAAVKHPNVVDITDVGVWQGRPYLVMELLEGEDLEAYLGRHKPLAEQDVARIMIPVIAGLATAHGAGVIHRDLKPSNVFLARGPDGEVVPKLLDFGISKLANSLRTLDPSSTPIGELMGSPMYMSPEAVRGTRDLTPQADQYSLGVMLYECVTGRPPFYGDTLLSVLEAVAHGNFESPRRFRPELSTVLEVAILRAMSREPTDRYPSVRELGRALCEAADQRTRLLWTPSFGLRDVPLGHGTANLHQVSALRTGSPLSASVGRRSRRPALWQLGLSAFALLLLAVAVVAYLRMPSYTVSLVAPGAVPGDPVATQQAALAAAPPASASPESPASGAASATPRAPSAAGGEPTRAGTNAVAPAAANRQGEERNGERAGERGAGDRSEAAAVSKAASDAKPSSPAASSTSAQSRPPAPAKAASAKRPARPAAPAARDTARSAAPPASPVEAAPEPRVAEDDDDDIFMPARAPSPAGPSPVLGANQSPILD